MVRVLHEGILRIVTMEMIAVDVFGFWFLKSRLLEF